MTIASSRPAAEATSATVRRPSDSAQTALATGSSECASFVSAS